MNRNTVQRSPRGGVGVGGHCSLPGGRPCGMRGRGAPGLAPPLCGHSSLAAGQAGPRCTHTRTRRGGAQGATSARRKQTRITPRGPDPLPLAWGPASGTHPQHPHPCSPSTSVQTPGRAGAAPPQDGPGGAAARPPATANGLFGLEAPDTPAPQEGEAALCCLALLPGSFPAERILRNELFLGGCPHPPTPQRTEA